MSDRVRLENMVPKGIRFPSDLIKQVHEARKPRGLTFQAFVLMALRKEVDAVRAEVEQDKRRKQQQREERTERAKPKGLGIRERLQEQEEAVGGTDTSDGDGEDEGRASPSPVTVNVGTTALAAPTTNSSIDLTTMAQMVLAAPSGLARDRVLKRACDTLAKRASSNEEALRLAEQLDTEIKRLDVPTTALDRTRARTKR